MPQITKKFTQLISKPLFFGALLIGLASCQSHQVLAPASTPDDYDQAMRLLATAQASEPQQSVNTLLQAAEIFINNQSWTKAQQSLQALPNQLSPSERQQSSLLWADTWLAINNANAAHKAMTSLNPAQLPPKQLQYWLRLKASLEQQKNHWHQSLTTEAKLSPLLTSASQKKLQAERIWTTLQNMPRPYPKSAPNQNLQAWYQLASLIVPPNMPSQTDIDNWKKAHPNHPGNILITQASNHAPLMPLKGLCLLLPESGPQKELANAIQHGFMTSFYLLPRDKRPTVFISDSAGRSITALHQQSKRCQASVALLSEEQAQQLAAHPPKKPMIILGNHQNSANTYAIDSSPTDTPETMVKQAKSLGIRRAIIIAPEQGQGRDLALSLDQAWQDHDGVVLTNLAFKPHTEHTTGIKNLLEIHQSLARKKLLERTIWQKVAMTPRRRQDIDGFFLLADSQEAQNIAPLLKFFYAQDIPVLLHLLDHIRPSHKSFYKDLSNTWIYAIPWVSRPTKSLPANLLHPFQANRTGPLFNRYIQYYALGNDSLHLAMQLSKLQNFPMLSLQGASGILSIDANKNVRRKLTWAQITPKGMRDYHQG